jgi:salicylate hydroxylase
VTRPRVSQPSDMLSDCRAEGSTNTELSHVAMPDMREKYGYPHCTGHRSSLAGSMYKGCQGESAIKFHFSTGLVSVDSYSPKPIITVKPRDEDPYQVEADVLLAADGIKSVTRTQMLGVLGLTSEEEDTGQAAYRIMLDRTQMQNDPEMLELLESDTVVRWIGERRHIIAYPVSNHTIYNLSSAQPDTNFAAATNATYTTKGSKKQMLDVYADFCPLVHRMLNLVPDGEVCEWKLRVYKALPTWVHGCVALLGDACHPTLPHLSHPAGRPRSRVQGAEGVRAPPQAAHVGPRRPRQLLGPRAAPRRREGQGGARPRVPRERQDRIRA